jgi:hypothetical protein
MKARPEALGVPSSSTRDGASVFALALALRVAIAIWAAPRFPPAADGVYYAKLARRLAEGQGYTWLWPDGVVTFAAHYPVGYPAALAALARLTGPYALLSWMLLAALLGAFAALGVHRLTARAGSRKSALVAGLLVALHPGLIAYTPAVMTEGVTASLLVLAAWLVARARESLPGSRASSWAPLAGLGLVLGLATLVRPQSLLLAPLFGALAWRKSGRTRASGALLVTAAALLVCAPWTLRNCARMHRCALVSVNGGWNLLIGADPTSTGAWSPVQVPPACAEVWDEAAKDACFGREARRYVAAHPLRWLALVPSKLAATFDYAGAGGYYLHASNAEIFSARHKLALGVVETVFERAVLISALLALMRPFRLGVGLARIWGASRRPMLGKLRLGIGAVGVAFALLTHAWVSYVALALLGLLRGRALARGPVLASAATAVLVATIATHAVFFGAGRYSLVVFPFVCGLAARARSKQDFDKPTQTPALCGSSTSSPGEA